MRAHAGQFRHRITVERPIEARDGGAVVLTWTPYATAWAKIEPVTAREYFERESQGAEVTHRITLRWLDGITAKMRIKTADGRVFNLTGPPRDLEERARLVELVAKEIP